MKFGFHIPTSGGLDKVPPRAVERGCETIQIFARSPRFWRLDPLSEPEVTAFKSGIAAASIAPVVIHTQYLVNLASGDPALWDRSWRSLAEDLRRADLLGAQFVVTHPGSRGETPPAQAIERAGKAIRRAFEEADSPALLLLENTAGAGRLLGSTFAGLAAISAASRRPERIGLALDTAHAFEAGYDVASHEGLEATLAEVEQAFGFDRLKLIHANDSATPLGSHHDRHWDIGEGFIGESGLPPVALAKGGFRLILSHPALRDLPFIMETPQFQLERDLRNMATIRRLAEDSKSVAGSVNRVR